MRNAVDIMAQLAEMTALAKETDQIIESLKDELKMLMTADGLEELEREAGKATYHNVTFNRFDQSAFKREHRDMYDLYTVPVCCQRFTFNA